MIVALATATVACLVMSPFGWMAYIGGCGLIRHSSQSVCNGFLTGAQIGILMAVGFAALDLAAGDVVMVLTDVILAVGLYLMLQGWRKVAQEVGQ